MLGGVGREMALMRRELWRRAARLLPFPRPAPRLATP